MRKLVTIRTVGEIRPIEGADFIELARVDGWQCVVKKGDFKVGDKGVYFEIDSFLPIEPRYEFLRKSSYRKMGAIDGFRLKTMKLRKTLSQGLLMPMSAFPEVDGSEDDLSGKLNVVKYEPPIPACLGGLVKGIFPGFIRKTDQERIQNLPEFFDLHKDLTFEVTEKMDGTSATFFVNDGVFGVCSRNMELKETEGNTFWKIAKEFKLAEKMATWSLSHDTLKNIAIQGEVIGSGICGNPYMLDKHVFMVFDIFDIDKHRMLTPSERNAVLSDELFMDLQRVPFIENSHPFDMTMDELIAYAGGRSMASDKVKREGVVFKSCELVDGDVISFKVINNEHLLEEK